MTNTPLDLITMGRVSMDLFSENIGAPFVEIEGFAAHVGGSPTNIAIGSRRLGARSAVLTAVGDDETGRFVRHVLQQEGVDTQFIPTKPGTSTPLAVVGVQPPDKFPLLFYRDNPADIYLNIDDVQQTPIAQAKLLVLSGTALSRGSCWEATLFAAEQAQAHGVPIFMDLDYRADQWHHPLAFGTHIRRILPRLDVVIGTEEEFGMAVSGWRLATSEDNVPRTTHHALEAQLRGLGFSGVIVLKRGAEGVSVYEGSGRVNIPGFPVEILNTVGAGDAFASGFVYSYLQGQSWAECARFGNACGAIMVTRHGCASAMPTREEVIEFIAGRD